MPIDLNIPPDQHGELLPDLNEEPAHEEDEIAHLQEDQLHEDEAQLPDQHGELLPDLNQKPAYEQEDKISHVSKIKFMQLKPISKVSPYIFITMNALVCMSSISTFMLPRENTNIMKRQIHQVHSMVEAMDEYGVHTDPEDIVFYEEELDDSDVEEHHNIEVSEQQQEMQQVINMMDDMHEYGVYANAVEVHFDEEELEDSDVEEDHHATQNRARPYRNLTDAERQQIYEALLKRSNHGRLKRKSTTVVAQLFKRAKQCRAQGRPVDVRSRMPKKCGRKKEGAKRRSRNRGRGAQVTKPIKVDRTTMRSYLIGKVLKAIVQKWPRELRGKTIYIQQDNARVEDEELLEERNGERRSAGMEFDLSVN
ncbi:unnamed protein product [Miscanthus lutarioriparius]|uniref:DUF7769 domain-containing protein n=1 Tax=Miscanthus lutarioriparius TaxID=422564 RepID=A0A811RJ95_9POAL|nr:unnamed protein product [Miscanthus lutarioriparius]